MQFHHKSPRCCSSSKKNNSGHRQNSSWNLSTKQTPGIILNHHEVVKCSSLQSCSLLASTSFLEVTFFQSPITPKYLRSYLGDFALDFDLTFFGLWLGPWWWCWHVFSMTPLKLWHRPLKMGPIVFTASHFLGGELLDKFLGESIHQCRC